MKVEESNTEAQNGAPKVWRSVEELLGDPAILVHKENEFPAGPEENWTTASRRRFLQLAGASAALAGASSCSWQKEHIMPFDSRPEGRLPGKPRFFATAMPLNGWMRPLVATSYDGRPTKIEGNDQHPASGGATDHWSQAGTLELYDPDRSRGPAQGFFSLTEGVKHGDVTWGAFEGSMGPSFEKFRASGGKGLAVLSQFSTSPTLTRLKEHFAKVFPKATWDSYEPLSRSNEEQGCSMAFGKALRPVYHLGQARLVFSLDEDLFLGHPDAVVHQQEWARGRRPEDGDMSRCWAVETRFTNFGANADHRLPLRSSRMGAFLAALEVELVAHHGLKVPGGAAETPADAFLKDEETAAFLKALAKDLADQRGKGLLAVGPHQPAELHARAQRLNVLLGNVGKTVSYLSGTGDDPVAALARLYGRMSRGDVNTIVVLGGNPVYDAPGFAAAYAAVNQRIHLGLYRNETSLASTFHLPQAHWLESWGDGLSWNGRITLQQPLIDPIWGGRSAEEMTAWMSTGTWQSGRELLASTFGSGDMRSALHLGFLKAATSLSVKPNASSLRALPAVAPTALHNSFEVHFAADYATWDGRFANSGWLQELPDPMTTLTWDNAALISFASAEENGLVNGSVVEITLDGQQITIPVYLMPGHADGCLTLSLGYGRTAAGRVAGIADDMRGPDIESVGVDVNPLRSLQSFDLAAGATLVATGKVAKLATTQNHYAIDAIGQEGKQSRLGDLYREADLSEWEDHPDFAQHRVHHPPLESLWEERAYENVSKWGMSIDLASCTGCGGCTIACQSENNISVVGKEQVLKGREMHWIRIDRYFAGDPADPAVLQQPLTCQHCELAPCEQVCPVGATMHSEEGLNDMAYNRCVGTRYCANNCPYKVRRFNFHKYSEGFEDPGNEVMQLANNPEVTVRSRGIMEKCTFCVQRIRTSRLEAEVDGRELKDGDITPACAQACPTHAIEFGDLNDGSSRVRTAFDNPRAYEMLAELNNKTRTRYLARVRNPHPDLIPRQDAEPHAKVFHG